MEVVDAAQVRAFRVARQQLRPSEARTLDAVDALDLGVQDTGPDGARWALACRGADLTWDDLALAWTLRGAPHAYRRSDLAQVAAATAPFSEADAAKRVFDAGKPLRAAGVAVLDALDRIAGEMHDIVAAPTVKGEVSRLLSDRLPGEYVRYCRPCDATHVYEQPFRLAALRAGLELEPGTSPPVLRRIPGWRGPRPTTDDRFDVVRGVARLLGPTTPQDVAGYLDAPVTDVRRRWPADVAEVAVAGRTRWLLADDLPALTTAAADPRSVTLLAPYDPLLQARDRDLLVEDGAHRRVVWVVLGRPGVILRGADVVGTWRPRSRGRTLDVEVTTWHEVPGSTLGEAAELLAASRGSRLGSVRKA